MPTLFTNSIKDETGVTSIEYAIIGVLIAIVLVGVVTGLGANLRTIFSTISTSI